MRFSELLGNPLKEACVAAGRVTKSPTALSVCDTGEPKGYLRDEKKSRIFPNEACPWTPLEGTNFGSQSPFFLDPRLFSYTLGCSALKGPLQGLLQDLLGHQAEIHMIGDDVSV